MIPTVKQAVCVGGVVSVPSLELAITNGVTYTAKPPGPYAPGDG